MLGKYPRLAGKANPDVGLAAPSGAIEFRPWFLRRMHRADTSECLPRSPQSEAVDVNAARGSNFTPAPKLRRGFLRRSRVAGVERRKTALEKGEIDGLGEVLGKPGALAPGDVVIHAETAHCDAAQILIARLFA